MDLDYIFPCPPGMCGVPHSLSYCVFPTVREALRGGPMQSSPYETCTNLVSNSVQCSANHMVYCYIKQKKQRDAYFYP